MSPHAWQGRGQNLGHGPPSSLREPRLSPPSACRPDFPKSSTDPSLLAEGRGTPRVGLRPMFTQKPGFGQQGCSDTGPVGVGSWMGVCATPCTLPPPAPHTHLYRTKQVALPAPDSVMHKQGFGCELPWKQSRLAWDPLPRPSPSWPGPSLLLALPRAPDAQLQAAGHLKGGTFA